MLHVLAVQSSSHQNEQFVELRKGERSIAGIILLPLSGFWAWQVALKEAGGKERSCLIWACQKSFARSNHGSKQVAYLCPDFSYYLHVPGSRIFAVRACTSAVEGQLFYCKEPKLCNINVAHVKMGTD